ncbi:DSC E3 ubiquitin ligase complex subunit 2 [Escovopsis weberi]|uniref:DSC E3 ubiquitin ligase complex subunit 2 n=1 Tax=Escovopsis weberi TaxID=150374 RepID=A0A0N0RTQ0_ESCWE|nr:DSC E3 ubiquitin ligase complex subunit 2 [Escovopsis weberi]
MTFTNAPVTRLAVLGLVGSSIAVSLLDVKHYCYILLGTHIWRYRQLWRLLTYQLCYTNSTEVLFAAISLYNLRSVERMWGSRKYASFLFVLSLFTAVFPPLVMAVLRPLAPELFDYVPAGPTPVIFAALAQFHAMVPHMYKYRIAASQAPPTPEPFSGLTLSDKSYQYGLAVHLALLQWPGSVVGAAVGWAIGHWWRGGLLPSPVVGWRLPGWMVGLRAQRRSAEFEGLRRRLEGENAAGTATGAQAPGQGQQGEGAVVGQADRRRTMGQQIVDQFREAL